MAATPTQTRIPLDRTTQQAANAPLAVLVSAQLETFDAVGTIDGEKDIALADASGGTFTLTLPDGNSVLIGKSYTVKEFEGSNPVTIAAADSGTIDGAATLVVAAGEAATVIAQSVDAATNDVTWQVVSQTAPNPAAGGELLAANDLSDVADADTARANLDAGRQTVTLTRLDLIGANAAVYRYVHQGPDATIVTINSSITGALTTGDATITASIDAVAVTDGVITITQAASAAGDVDTATPSAANVISAGETLELTVGGTNDAAEFADVSVELTY